MEEVFNFAEVEVPVSNNEWLREPGLYKAKIVETNFVKVEGKTPYLAVTYETSKGKLLEKYWVTAGGMGRLKQLYEEVWKKDLTQLFNSASDVGNYFVASLKKQVELRIRVGLEVYPDGKKYAKLTFFDAFYPEEGFEEKVFQEGTPEYNLVVTKKEAYTAPTSATVIQPQVQEKPLVTNSDSDDLPF